MARPPRSGFAGRPGPARDARMCGATLARAHARLGDWIAIASYLGKGTVVDEALADDRLILPR